VIGKKVTELIPNIRESNPEFFEIYGRVSLSGQPEKFETYVAVWRMWFSITAYSSSKGYFIAVFNDITERKRTEVALLRANRALKTLSAGNLALVRAASEDELLREVTQVIVEKGGYYLRWWATPKITWKRSSRPWHGLARRRAFTGGTP